MGLTRMQAPIRRVAARAPVILGSPWAFVGGLLSVLGWLAVGPFVGWSSQWLLVPASVTSIFAFLLVLVLQYSQNRDTRTVQLKLDELIRSLGDARTNLVRLEQLSDEELDAIEAEFHRLRRAASREG
jgi:low affinity Fe/Cu permease